MIATREDPLMSTDSLTDRILTGVDNLHLVVRLDESGCPFEVFGWIGKTGTLGRRMTSLQPGE